MISFQLKQNCQSNFVKMFMVYVRPLLEYASPVWSPAQLYALCYSNSLSRTTRDITPAARASLR